MIVIGLTGNIGSGKTLAAHTLAECGARVIEADKVARDIVEPGQPAWNDIRISFGEEYLLPDGHINRRKLGEKVFSSSEAKELLNRITHPRIKAEIKKEIANIYREDSTAVVVVEAAVLIEMDAMDLVDEVWLLQASDDSIIKRITKRDSFTVEEVKARLSSQLPPQELAGFADRIIVNDGSCRELKEKIKSIYKGLLSEK